MYLITLTHWRHLIECDLANKMHINCLIAVRPLSFSLSLSDCFAYLNLEYVLMCVCVLRSLLVIGMPRMLWMHLNVRRVTHQRCVLPIYRRGERQAAIMAECNTTTTAGAGHHLLRLLATVGHYATYAGCAGCASETRLLHMLVSNLTVRVHVQRFPGIGHGTRWIILQ